MPELQLATQYLTNKYFVKVINHLKWAGVKIDHENRIAGVTYFQSGKNLNMMQLVFLDANIPIIVSEYLSSVEGKLKKEFVNSSNTHSHATVFTMKGGGEEQLGGVTLRNGSERRRK